jgi:hypothetical protein
MCHSLNFILAESRLQFATAIGARGAIDSSPDTPGDLEDTVVDIGYLQIALLEEPPKPEVFVLFCFGQLAYLHKIDGHPILLFRIVS